MRQNWLQLLAIQIGGAVCLPIIFVGSVLMQAFGALSAIVAIVCGNLVLLGISLVMVKMTHSSRATTMENAAAYFGKRGSKLFAAIFALALTGWFALQIGVVEESLASAGLSFNGFALVAGVLFTLSACRGMGAIARLSQIATPILAICLGYALWKSEITIHPSPIRLGAISIVMAAAIGASIDLPTFFRFAKTARDGYIAVIALFALAIPLVEICGVYVAESFFQNRLMIPFLILAGWTTNAANLFSSVTCMESIFPRGNRQLITCVLGLIGTLLACFNIIEYFLVILELIGAAITAMGTVIVARYFLEGPRATRLNFLAWGVGTLIGYLATFDLVSITSIPQLDAALISLICVGVTYEKVYAR